LLNKKDESLWKWVKKPGVLLLSSPVKNCSRKGVNIDLNAIFHEAYTFEMELSASLDFHWCFRMPCRLSLIKEESYAMHKTHKRRSKDVQKTFKRRPKDVLNVNYCYSSIKKLFWYFRKASR